MTLDAVPLGQLPCERDRKQKHSANENEWNCVRRYVWLFERVPQ